MQRYIFRRLLQVVPILLLVSIAAFLAMHMIPGGPIAIYGRSGITPEAAAAIRQRLGLDDPLIVQYLRWLTAALAGDLGYSFTTGRPVISEIGARLVPTILLMGSTFVVVLFVSIALGILQAVRQYSRLDIVLTTLSFAGAAMPVFWVGLLLILIDNAVRNPMTGRPFLPIGGMTSPGGLTSPLDLLAHLAMPMLALALGWVSWYARYVRASMLDVVHEDYIRTARAKGVRERTVVFKHGFKNAAIPLVTVVALDLPYLFAGALFVEIIFAWPGMGQLFYRAAVIRDYPLMLGVIIVIAVLVLLGNLLADILYAYLDPTHPRRSQDMMAATRSTPPLPHEADVQETMRGIVWAQFRHHPVALIALATLAIVIVVSVLAFLSPYDPDKIDLTYRWAPPTLQHWFGTDKLGRDLFTRILYGGRISLTVGFLAMAGSVLIGTFVGAVAGFFGGSVDSLLMRLTDFALTFPQIFVLLFLSALLLQLDSPLFSGGFGMIVVVIPSHRG